MPQPITRILSIAGSDSGGGAGIEADLKTIAALGGYGMAAVTSVTAQNTTGVFAVHDIPPGDVAKQIEVVIGDIGVDAVKTGMLSNLSVVEAVAGVLEECGAPNLVVDPVMVAKSGDALLQPEACAALKELLLPLAYMVTPNVPEAEVLTGISIREEADLRRAAEALLSLGPRYVLMKGGHLKGEEAVDYLFGEGLERRFSAPRIRTNNTHGTGCTFSAAIAAYLGHGEPVEPAVSSAKAYLTRAIETALPLGAGHGPLNHLWPLEQ